MKLQGREHDKIDSLRMPSFALGTTQSIKEAAPPYTCDQQCRYEH